MAQEKTEAKKGILNEDWLAFWMAILLVAVSMLSYAGIDVFGWMIKVKEWVTFDQALTTISKGYKDVISGGASLILTYLFLSVILSVGVYLLGGNVKRFLVGFFFVYWLSMICWIIGHYAYLAATDPAKHKISWSLKLTGEGGYILALVLGLLLGNFARGFVTYIEEALKPEFYIKTAIGLMGAVLGLKSAAALGLASAVFFRGLCAIVEAYLIYWALVYFIARRWFKFSREWAAPLAAGISICGVSAAIATGGAIRARPVVPIMVASLVVIFAVVELVILPFIARAFLWQEPMVAGAWMGLAVKTDGAAFAAGAITDALIRGKAEAVAGIKYEPGWILMATATTKLFIDIFISIWAFLLAYIWCAHIESKPGEKVSWVEIWRRFPKFVLAYALGFVVFLLISAPHAPKVQAVDQQTKLIQEKIKLLEKQVNATTDPSIKEKLTKEINAHKEEIKKLKEEVKESAKVVSQTKTATSGLDGLRKLFFLITFFTIGAISNFRKLWAEGIGKLAVVYFVALFGFIIWIGLIISYIFFKGVKPPIIQ